jgi:hypothetical protein
MDITKCLGQIGAIDCPYKEKCYRFTAKGDELYQSYFMELPLKDGKCDHYWGENEDDLWNQSIKSYDNSNNT